MNDSGRWIGVRGRAEQRYLLIVYGVPMFLALITTSSHFIPFLNGYRGLIALFNCCVAAFVTLLAGLFQRGIETPLARRVARGIGDGVFGGLAYGVSIFAIVMLVMILNWVGFI